MTTIRLVGSTPREIAATGQVVEPGGTVDVDDVLAVSLCDQPDVWVVDSPKNVKNVKAAKSADTVKEG